MKGVKFMKCKKLFQALLAGTLAASLCMSPAVPAFAEETGADSVVTVEEVVIPDSVPDESAPVPDTSAPAGDTAESPDITISSPDVTIPPEDAGAVTPDASGSAVVETVPEVPETPAADGTTLPDNSGDSLGEVVEAGDGEIILDVADTPITTAQTESETEAETAAETETEPATEAPLPPSPTRVTVHDPSIVKAADGIYYVLGSHTASARSADLIQWDQINTDYGNVDDTPFYGNLLETFEKPFQWAGYDDGDCAGGYAIWAPDAIWNPYYEWEDGSTGAWMLYCCTSSTWRRSCISYLVSKNFAGPYEFGDTIIYSGFTMTGEPDGNSTRDTKWDNDYLNLSALIELGSENGGIDEISENWFDGNGGWNNNYAPNAIDPNLFFDASGEKLYMSYGSWSGGMFLLELDPATGEAIYPGVDSVDEVSGNFVDRYFGVHLIGANHQSGEAPYIRYDSTTGYYYLYVTYGGLTAEGGYNMRLFRSENPTGPYLDAKGGNAADNGTGNDAYGIKLIGNYSFYDQIGKRAAGHNSALIDDDGSHYLVYHQRFDIEPQLEAHEVRVHQQFMNEDLWPVTAVYEYRGETPTNYDAADVVGSYEFINHGTTTSGEMLKTQMLVLNEDGTVSGAAAGTWTKSDSGKGYDYVTFVLDDVTYKGIFFRQLKENLDTTPVMTFTAIGENNESIWGSMIDMENTEMVVDMASISIGQMIPKTTKEYISLPTSVMGADVQWSSSDEAVISAEGVVTPQAEDSRVELTAVISSGDFSQTETYKVVVRGIATLIVGYDFETATTTVEDAAEAPEVSSEAAESNTETAEAAEAASEQSTEVGEAAADDAAEAASEQDAAASEITEDSAEAGSPTVTTVPPVEGSSLMEDAVLNGTASIVQDETRGSVLQITNDPGAQGVNFLRLPEDTLKPVGPAGYTVAMWVNIGAETFEHSALFEADAQAQYPLTRIGANLIARINANAYSDVQGALLTTSGERDVWQHVVYTVDPQGIKVYLNGALVGQEVKNIEDCFKKNKTGISQAKDVMVGSGYIWGDEDCQNAKFDDVMVYDGVLTAGEVQELYAKG